MVVGILSRENLANAMAINAAASGKKIQILVENQGRINYNVANDFKGILSAVRINDAILKNWTITGFPLEDVNQIERFVSEVIKDDSNDCQTSQFSSDILMTGPKIFHATFDIDVTEIHDTYINTNGWGKVCKQIIEKTFEFRHLFFREFYT